MAKHSKKLARGQRAITAGKIRKLQRAGLLSAKINPNKRPAKSTINSIFKYRGVLSGRQAAVKLSDSKKAAALRAKIGDGGRGKIVVVPREKGERFKVVGGNITSTRKQYGQTIQKTIGDKFTAPKPGEKIYYTIPSRKRGLGKLKRHTFSSFDELLFYLQKYEVDFEDIEDYIEVEKFSDGSRRQKQHQREYNTAVKRLKNKRASRPSQRNKRKSRSARRHK